MNIRPLVAHLPEPARAHAHAEGAHRLAAGDPLAQQGRAVLLFVSDQCAALVPAPRRRATAASSRPASPARPE